MTSQSMTELARIDGICHSCLSPEPRRHSGIQRWIRTGVIASPDGSSVYGQGSLWNGTSDDFAAISYDAATGAQRWATTLGTPWNGFDNSTSLGISPDSHVLYLTGTSQHPSSDYGYLTVAFQA